ncbi:unnamed protein product [Tilletia controversa]|uniref:Uncharacterized protein n=4 Tax=Tilletia TaxID=13289 RepID=A0A8X7SZT1_9BASI|nr:hypothetical protein CF336_g1046 [Tilletia laevis]KAE8204617.1 hypothetical protein CF328_g975 [Tilletia controversa]KAE8262611.1 hypothetical protein A4X03_0g2320 [Tilletia caries]KAE8205937.1 hypothetical protein CF335_g2139 [Tilletia laevis]KAE8253534.1 hypothetical protein A4X06_0g1387 [Tilletia controversa]
MVVVPTLTATANPTAEVWDNDDDFDFEEDGEDAKAVFPQTVTALSLRRPASFISDVDVDIDIDDEQGDAAAGHSGSSGSVDHRGPASVSGSASSRTSRSGMSSSAHTYRSTDLTDLEGSPSTSHHHGDPTKDNRGIPSGLSPHRPYNANQPLSTSPTAIENPFNFQGRTSPQGLDAFSEHETDFDLGEGVQQLHLSPSMLRKRPSANHWDGDEGMDGKSASEAGAPPSRSSPSPSHRSLAESDNDGALGDDESEAAELIEEGLDLPESIFGKPDEQESPSVKLRAMLDARLRGQHLSSGSPLSKAGEVLKTSDRLAGGALDFDADTDVVTGLVITDDMELSPSRLAAKSLSFKTRRSLGGFIPANNNTVPRSQHEYSRQAFASDRQRPSGSNAKTWTNSPRNQLPTVVLTNSSPAGQDRTLHSQRSPPRAISSYSHAPGTGPKAFGIVTTSKGDPFRSASPSSSATGSSSSKAATNKNQSLLSPDAVMSSSSGFVQSQVTEQRRKSLVRKRSMPMLSDANATTPSTSSTSTSAALSAVHASIAANTNALSRLMASTASSRAREAETAARLAARASPEAEYLGDSAAGSPTAIRLPPPSRPSTPVNGAVRYTLSTGGSRIRRIAAGAAAGAASMAAGMWDRDTTSGSPRPGSASSQRGMMYSAITASAAAAKDAARVMRRPARSRNYGTGNELDDFDDLPTNQEAESQFRRTPLRQASNASQMAVAGDETLKVRPRDLPNLVTSMKDAGATLTKNNFYGSANAVAGPSNPRSASRAGSLASAAGNTRKRNQRGGGNKSKGPTLIQNLGGNSTSRSRVVGDMRWNPAMQRWEGNESALRAFDNVINSSSRPALISPLTTGSVSSLVSSTASLLSPRAGITMNPLGGKNLGKILPHLQHQQQQSTTLIAPRLKHTISSPGSMASSFVEPQGSLQGTRIVGDMMFDPVRMCWLSMADTEEPDVFAGLGDEDGDALSSGGERDGGVSSSGRPRRGSGLTTAGGGWSSGWGGLGGRGGRSSTAPTTDEEDEMSRSVGCSDPGAGGLVANLTAAAPHSAQLDSAAASQQQPPPQQQQQQQQQQQMTARRIKSADLLRTVSSSSSSGGVINPLGPLDTSTLSPTFGMQTSPTAEDDELCRLCLEAETRHRKEVRGFLPRGATALPSDVGASRSLVKSGGGGGAEVDTRSHLYLLQRLAREACP